MCEHCSVKKQTRVSLRHDISRKNDVPDLVHSDVYDPLKVWSMGGA